MKRQWFVLLVALCATASWAAGLDGPRSLEMARPSSNLSAGTLTDFYAPWTPGPGVPVPDGDTLEYFGNTSTQYGPLGARQRGNIYRFDVPNTRILEIRQYFNPTASGVMCFMVYESVAESVGTYNLVDSVTITCGTGAGWYSSGSRDYMTTPGKYYAIVTGWVPTANYYANLAVAPWPFPSSFGAQIGAIGYASGSGWTWTYPPPATQTVAAAAFSASAAYYQALLTSSYTPTPGDLGMYSIEIPSGSYQEPNVGFMPQVIVNNPGTTPVSNFQVVFNIEDDVTKTLVYADTTDVAGPLDPGSFAQINFGSFIPLDLTNYNVTAYVSAAGDPYAANDTLHAYFRTFNELLGQVADDNAGGAGLAGAKVKVTGPATDSTFTDGSGDYFFFDLTAGTYTVTATKAGYITETATGVEVTNEAQTTLDISMGYPELVLTPTDSIYCTLPWGLADSTTWQFTLENAGTRDMTYSVAWPELVKGAKAPVSLVLDDGSRDNDIGLGGTIEMIFGNRFTPGAAEFPFTLNQVQVYFSSVGLVNVGDDIQILVYENTTGGNDPAVGSNLLYQYNTTAQVIDAWSVYDLPDPVLLNGPGDVFVAVLAMETPGTSYWPASLDQTATQQRSWAGWWNASPPPAPPTLPPENWILIDTYFPGNWMVRGYGETGGGNVVWLNIEPAAGTVSAYNSQALDVTFDTATLDSFVDYAANVRFRTNAAADQFVPAYLHVVGTGVSGGPGQPLTHAFGLNANRPNPVRGRTSFSFTLPKASDYSLKVYNVSGQLVESFSGKGQAGANSVSWNAQKAGAGVYLYRLSSGGQSATRKLVVIK